MTKKKKAKKKVVKKKVVKSKAKNVLLPVEDIKYYRIDVEFPSEHGFSYRVLFDVTKQEEMKRQVAKLKEAGMGGRAAFLDGTPEGQVVETWGSVERVAEAEAIEQKSLDK